MAQSEENYLYLVLFLTQVTNIACVAGEGMTIQLFPHFPTKEHFVSSQYQLWSCNYALVWIGKASYIELISLSLQICWLSWKIITHRVIIEANSRKLCRRILDVNDNSPINSLSFSDLCVCVLVAQSRPKFCDPRDCSLPGSSVHEFSRQEYWSGKPFPSPGDLPDPGIEPRFPSLQADSLPSEPPDLHCSNLANGSYS